MPPGRVSEGIVEWAGVPVRIRMLLVRRLIERVPLIAGSPLEFSVIRNLGALSVAVDRIKCLLKLIQWLRGLICIRVRLLIFGHAEFGSRIRGRVRVVGALVAVLKAAELRSAFIGLRIVAIIVVEARISDSGIFIIIIIVDLVLFLVFVLIFLVLLFIHIFNTLLPELHLMQAHAMRLVVLMVVTETMAVTMVEAVTVAVSDGVLVLGHVSDLA